MDIVLSCCWQIYLSTLSITCFIVELEYSEAVHLLGRVEGELATVHPDVSTKLDTQESLEFLVA